jgi:hypothetical protein
MQVKKIGFLLIFMGLAVIGRAQSAPGFAGWTIGCRKM